MAVVGRGRAPTLQEVATVMHTEIDKLRRTISTLTSDVRALRQKFGDAPAVRRLANDVERLSIDADDFTGSPSAEVPQQKKPDHGERVIIPDAPYDESLWEGADDEGVGGYRGDKR